MGPPGTEPVVRVLHVRKDLPSRSGVARYAATFGAVLAECCDEFTPFGTGGDPQATRRIRVAIRTARRCRRTVRAFRPTHVWFELSGGAVAEFWAMVVVLCMRQRPAVIVTLHDPPAVVGGSLAFPRLDRRPLRRAAALLAPVGERIEQLAVSRVDAAVSLSSCGLEALRDMRGLRDVAMLPPFFGAVASPVVELSDPVDVFVPGPVTPDDAAMARRWLASLPFSVRVSVGMTEHPATPLPDGWEPLGLLDDEHLTEAYRTAHLVVRLWAADDVRFGWGNSAAVSGPVIDAVLAGAVMVTNCARGGAAWVEAASGIDLPRGAPLDDAATMLADRTALADRMRRARQWASTEHGPAAQRERVRSVLALASLRRAARRGGVQ
jgi:hypothetical protein